MTSEPVTLATADESTVLELPAEVFGQLAKNASVKEFSLDGKEHPETVELKQLKGPCAARMHGKRLDKRARRRRRLASMTPEQRVRKLQRRMKALQDGVANLRLFGSRLDRWMEEGL